MEESNDYFTKNQLNFFRVCHLVCNVLPIRLRNVFVKQWNRKYGSNSGGWSNDVKSGEEFVRLESPQNQKRNKELLNTMVHGDIAQWDCTILFYAILYSHSIGDTLDAKTRKHVNNLRNFRNDSFAHVCRGEISSSDFQKIINKVLQAFLSLGFETSEIKKIQNQTFFSREEVCELREKLEREKRRQEQLDARISDLELRVTCLEGKAEHLAVPNPSPRSSTTPSTSSSTEEPLRSLFTVLPPRPPHQVIRSSCIDKAQNAVTNLKSLYDKRVTTTYIVGGPGVGKTECARQLGKGLSEQSTFVMTLEADTFEHFASSVKDSAFNLGFSDDQLPCLPQASAQSQTEVMSLFIKDKMKTCSSWLLILNGLSEETRDMQGYLPKAGDHGKGHMIITTMDRTLVADNPYTSCVDLSNCLTADETLKLLSAIAAPVDKGTTMMVAEKLEYNPMFLASTAIRVKKLSVKNRKTIDGTWKEFLGGLQNRYQEEEQPYYLASLNQSTRTKLKSLIDAIMGRNLVFSECFHLLVMAKGSALPLNFVTGFLSFQLDLSEGEVEILLRDCPVLVFCKENALKFIRVHGVIYKLLCDKFAPTVRTEQMVQRLRCVCHFAVNNSHNPMVCQVFKLFTHKILQYLSLLDLRFSNNDGQRSLHHELGKAFHCVLVDYSSAVRCFTKAMSFFEDSNDIAHVEYAQILSSLGNVFRLTGSTDEACKYLNKSLKLLKADSKGLFNEDIARCLSSLGLVYQSRGDLDQARELHRRALMIREEIHGEDHIRTATSLNNIGGVYHESGDLTTAKDYYWKALEIKGRNYGWDFPHVANSFNNIAEISHEQGDLCGAVSIHKRALKIRQRLYGDDHPDIANSFNNIGVIYHKLRELSSARKYHVKALEIRKKIYGSDHTEVASSLSNLGEVYYDEGDLAAAESCHIDALNIRQRCTLTSFYPHVITSLRNLMKVYVADRKIATAKEYAYEIVKILQHVYGMKDPRTVNAFRRLTDLSKSESEGHSFDVSFNIYEEVERLSSL